MHQSTPGAFEKDGQFYKNVEDVRAKDLVLSWNEKTGEFGRSRASCASRHSASSALAIRGSADIIISVFVILSSATPGLLIRGNNSGIGSRRGRRAWYWLLSTACCLRRSDSPFATSSAIRRMLRPAVKDQSKRSCDPQRARVDPQARQEVEGPEIGIRRYRSPGWMSPRESLLRSRDSCKSAPVHPGCV